MRTRRRITNNEGNTLLLELIEKVFYINTVTLNLKISMRVSTS